MIITGCVPHTVLIIDIIVSVTSAEYIKCAINDDFYRAGF